MLPPEVGRVLQVTACSMYLADKETSRSFAHPEGSGFVTTGWKHYFIGARAKGVLFNASIVEIRVQYEANFLLDIPELDRAKQFLEHLESVDMNWQGGSLVGLPANLDEALSAFSGSRRTMN